MEFFTIKSGKSNSLILELQGLFVASCYNIRELQEEQEEIIAEIKKDGLESVLKRLFMLDGQRREPLLSRS